MNYGSVCSGIEAASVAWEPLGWKPAWFSEIEKFPSAVLAHRFPEVRNLGDMTKLHDNDFFRKSEIDLLVGGTPCQSFSVAGLRKGLDDPRGNLALEFLRIAEIKRPRWILWENVPGVLSSGRGRDFGSFLGALGQLGYGWAYRILDAQFFGVPQRRRRVFVVGYFGDWRRAAAVLFERESLLRNSPPRGKKRQGTSRGVEVGPSGGRFTNVSPRLDSRCKDGFIRNQLGVGTFDIAPCIGASGRGFSRVGDPRGQDCVISVQTFDRQSSGEYGTDTVDVTVSARDYKSAADLVVGTLNANGKAGSATQQDAESGMLVCITGDRTHALRGEGHDASEDGTGRGNPIVSVFDPNQVTSKTNRSTPKPEVSHTLPAASNSPGAFHWNARAEEQKFEDLSGPVTRGQQPAIAFTQKDYGADAGETSPTLRAMGHHNSHPNSGGQVAIAIQERAVSENPDAGPDGVGLRTDGKSYTLEARQVPQAVAVSLRGRDGGGTAEITDGASPAIRSHRRKKDGCLPTHRFQSQPAPWPSH